ncbi:hypothetical protein ACOBQB_12620 [Streptomyces sp. G5(2025)]|uniref:hypothetical protein n=1 Tax=Streptomyces sp. G5(2025) TaxID=3406628 RepID=UPI003C18BA07
MTSSDDIAHHAVTISFRDDSASGGLIGAAGRSTTSRPSGLASLAADSPAWQALGRLPLRWVTQNPNKGFFSLLHPFLTSVSRRGSLMVRFAAPLHTLRPSSVAGMLHGFTFLAQSFAFCDAFSK